MIRASTSRLRRLAEGAEAPTYAALRAVAGFLFAVHGSQKLLAWPPGRAAVPLVSQLGLGGLIELVCGILIAVGLFTRPAAFLASGTMAVAYVQFHWKLSFADHAWLPLVNKGELAALYAFLFLFIAARGAGIASLDARRTR